MRPILNKWQIEFYIGKLFEVRKGYVFRLGILNIHTIPDEGCCLSKSDYKGFLIEKRIVFK
jgi:hypothetical protein